MLQKLRFTTREYELYNLYGFIKKNSVKFAAMKKILIIGGGAAGFFAAIQIAQNTTKPHQITILEQSKKVLEKVKISGGGRCNVTHACFDPRELVSYYPRGNKALLGPFHQFMCGDMMAWLADQNVETKIEEDGRIFPITDNSQTIIDCFQEAVQRLKIKVQTQTKALAFHQHNTHWLVETNQGTLKADKIIMATGSSRSIWEQLKQLGHHIETPAPSLFTFKIKDPLLKDLPGLSVKNGGVKVKDAKLQETGPILITHWGLSGPGILKLSAWGARQLQERQYQFTIYVNWTNYEVREVQETLRSLKQQSPKKKLISTPLFEIPKRLWSRMIERQNLTQKNFADLSKKDIENLTNTVAHCALQVSGKSTNKDEFVTCGGIRLNEVNFKTMQSKIHPNLYFAGEILDIDALTGGFNFQAAWTTAWVAAKSIVEDLR